MLVTPDFRRNEVRSFVAHGLKDFSVSRLASKMSWGVPVPGDDEHVMYVWFDALVSYISALGWPADTDQFDKYWADGLTVQYCGQDNLRQQSAMWQAMLLAAGLPTTDRIYINGFVVGEGGVKMSKTIGNVVDPIDIINMYGNEALRYVLVRYVHPFDGSPVSIAGFHDRYTADLVNGIGNLTSRLLTLGQGYLESPVEITSNTLPADWIAAFEDFRPDIGCEILMKWMSDLDKDISDTEPYKLV